ncbi:BA14K family protein (plasmid) [Rhizobium leguminosarum]|uniref:BA14K family protein n=2 Tax=Rhizobium TaxID=379 RepID=UPI0009B77708|nr:BA14K family protein [Rhizobium leguminosarum]MVO92851.1 hypothetical protein [Rhizobium leguminosarum bv. phaseoli]NKK02314.1 hypothetical protein [Rhizobium leguminosarum bv. viciae]NKK86001.1 hypothetical protein [Rhizobium leguminosarum bv. viciae]RWX32623.1 BA14K family protein [Rhizobium leguminosarum]
MQGAPFRDTPQHEEFSMKYLLTFATVLLLLAAQSAAMAQVPPPIPLLPGPPGPPPVIMPPPPEALAPSEEYSNQYDGRHYAWCARRYRSYSAYDNSFQPSRGPRRQCYSPYD